MTGGWRPEAGDAGEGVFRRMRFLFLLFVLVSAAFGQTRTVVAISHRGEHLHHPENTVPAYREAIRLGADYFEVDVQTTSDGKLVLMHDGTVDRCTNGRGKISEMTFDQVRALDAGMKRGAAFAGTKVPTFDEALELAQGRAGIYVDAKAVSAKDLVEAIEKHAMVDHVVIYGRRPLLKEISAQNPRLKIMPESVSVEVVQSIIEQLHPRVIAFTAADFVPDVIRIARQSGALIYVDRMGQTDAPAGWQSAIDAGADGIQTDRPGELASYLREKGYKRN